MFNITAINGRDSQRENKTQLHIGFHRKPGCTLTHWRQFTDDAGCDQAEQIKKNNFFQKSHHAFVFTLVYCIWSWNFLLYFNKWQFKSKNDYKLHIHCCSLTLKIFFMCSCDVTILPLILHFWLMVKYKILQWRWKLLACISTTLANRMADSILSD